MAIINKIALMIFLLISVTLSSEAQTLKAYVNAAETAFTQKNHYAALEYYGILLEIEPQNSTYLYKYAESARGFNAYGLADTSYQKVRLQADTIYPLATFWEAKMKQRLGNYVPAQKQFEAFLTNHSKHDVTYTMLAKKAIEEIDWAIETASEPNAELKIARLSDNINSDFSEFAPMQDGDKIYYSSFSYTDEKDDYRPARQFAKVFVSQKEEAGQWMGDFNDTKRHTAHFAFNADSTTVYYTLCDYITTIDIRCELYSRTVNPDGSFGESVKLPEAVNQVGSTATQPHIGIDEETGQELLFFSSDRTGGKGGLDIWCSNINNGEVSNPINLPQINSADDEITPFYHIPSQTLYFSSNGFLNLGGYDVFKSEKKQNSWTSPENLGAPINSSYNDTHYWLNPGSMFGLLSSNRLGSNYLEEEKEACCYDIYRSTSTVIDLMAFSFNKKNNNALNGAKVTLYELLEDGTLVEIDSQINEEGNDFNWKLETGKTYVIKAEKDKFLPVLDTINLKDPNLLASSTLERKLYLEPITLDLMAYTFDKENAQALVGTKMTLSELSEKGQLIELETLVNQEGNDFKWKLEPDKKYVITAEKERYKSASDTIDLMNITTSKLRDRKLYLRPLDIAFLARTFYEDTKKPLKGVTIQIFKNGEEEDLVTNKLNNEFPFEFQRNQKYTIIASRPGFFPDTLVLDMKELGNPASYTHDFYLKEKSIADIVPLILYFDNDQPNPRTMRVTSDKTYSETANSYYNRKPVFIDEYTQALEGRDRFLAENRLEAFFEREVKDGDENFLVFSYKLVDLLEAGQIIKIYIKGYASPRAGAEYNFNLGRRRVHCIRNHFDVYNGGVFKRFLANNQLTIEEISFGSSKAPSRLNDKLSDDRESVFGILASRERRVEIVGIRVDDGQNVIDTVNQK